MRTTWLMTMVLGLLAALAVPAMGAPPTAQPYSMTETQVGMADVDRDWYSGEAPVWHVRGWTADYRTDPGASELVAGDLVVTANWNLNLARWRGNLWGTADYAPDAYPGSGWTTTWSARWIGPGTWAGHGVGDGFGDFEGMKIRYEVRNIPSMDPTAPLRDMVTGVIFTPGRP